MGSILAGLMGGIFLLVIGIISLLPFDSKRKKR